MCNSQTRFDLKKYFLYTLFSFFLIATTLILPAPSSYGQYKILEDSHTLEKIHHAIDSIYDLNFEAADMLIAELEPVLHDYPGLYLLKAFYVRWKYQPIKKDQQSFAMLESYLEKGIELGQKMLDQDKDNVEANFFLMASHALLAELYVNNGMNFKALGQAKSAYNYIKIGFEYIEQYPEFYFSSGIYNYYREKYPEENPFYKSFIWFFRNGDKARGLEMLKKGAELAVFTKTECYNYLFHIYLRYEDKPLNAIFYAGILKDKYPHNLYFLSNYIENSIRLHRYDGLYPYIAKLLESDKDYYRYHGEIFYGIYLEKAEQNLTAAIDHYRIADELGNKNDSRTPHYDSMLFLGLGRIYKTLGQKDKSKDYLKKSVKSAEYIAYRKDAQKLLDD